MNTLRILGFLLATWIAWGCVTPIIQLAQRSLQSLHWTALSMACGYAGAGLIAYLVFKFWFGGEPTAQISSHGLALGALAGVCSMVGSLGVLLAIKCALATGDHSAAVWIGPLAISVASVVVVGMAWLLIGRHSGISAGYLNYRFLVGVFLLAAGALLVLRSRPA